MAFDGTDSRGREWFRPPRMGDPVEARLAATVHVLSLSFAVAIVGFGVASLLLLDRLALVAISASIAAVLMVAYLLAHRGSPRLAAHVLWIGTWLGSTFAVAITGSVNSPALGAYLIVVLAAGLLVGRAAAIATAALSALALVALARLEAHGVLPEPIVQTPWTILATELTLFVAAAGLLSDVLGRFQAAVTRAERSEARTRALIDQASDAIVVLDAEGNVLEASARAAEMSGYAREELTRMRFPMLFADDEADDRKPLPAELAAGGVVVRERWMQRRDGTQLSVENSMARLSDGRIQCIVRDVSARKRAERMQERLRRALDEADEGIALFDADRRLLYANRVFRRLYAVGDAQHVGTPVDEIAGASEMRAWWQRAQRELAHGRSFSGRFERRLPEAFAVHHATLACVPGHEGEPDGFVVIVRDITREFELEESVQLSRKLDIVGQLASGLVHEFNNLLTVILGSAEAIRGREMSEDVEQILEAAERAAALTTKLASFTRNQAVRITRLDLNRVVRDASSMLQRLVRENVGLRLNLATEALWVQADPNQLHQVLVNLATNARDAMPDGGALEVSTAAVDLSTAMRPARVRLPDGPYAALSVHDSGGGMSEEVIEHVFEPFFTTKEPGRGTGLGLASVHQIVEQMGGAIDVESRLGHGTRLRIFLPLVLPPESQRGKRQAGPRPQPGLARILVVEDETLLRGLVARSLESSGHQVVSARHGREALELALAEPPDLVVTDVILPDLDGEQLVARLRERQPRLRVLLVSGYEPERVAGATGEDDQTLFLAKPFTIAQLVASVDALLAPRR
jgi:two-component system cell cycle sensor histidine kinase/response regulator CckA